MNPTTPRSDPRRGESNVAAGGAPPTADLSLATLLRSLADDTTTLVTKELALARTEVGRSIDSVKAAVAGLVTGAVVLVAGLGLLLVAVVYALVEVADMQRWTAALLVGGVVTVIGAVLVSGARSKLSASNIVPERTVQSLQKDQELVRSKVS